MSFREQVASDFAEVAAEVGVAATSGTTALTGVWSSVQHDLSLGAGGFEQEITSQFRFDSSAHDDFMPAHRSALVIDGTTYRVLQIQRGASHPLVTLGLTVA
jgi:phenylacetate-coenzyme A ligase PaaK-like adenylate-forming protein